MSRFLYSRFGEMQPAIRRVTLSPLLTLPTFVATTYRPDSVRRVLLALASRLPAFMSSLLKQDVQRLRTVVTIWFALSMIRQLNGLLNMMAGNAWRITAAKGWDWPNEIAVVTGGSSGIGANITQRLAAMGVRVAILDVQPAPSELLGSSGRITYYECDVTSSESIAAAAGAIRKDFGHPTILINNAGMTFPRAILNIPEASLRKVFGVNSICLWLTTQQFLPHMIQANKGHVMTVASMASFLALPCAADYGATKAAALAFHESLTCELKHYYKAPNVLTTVVHPNFVRTPLLKDFGAKLENAGVRMLTVESVADQMVARITGRRGGQLIMPESAAIATGLRGWPTWMQELMRDVFGRRAAQDF